MVGGSGVGLATAARQPPSQNMHGGRLQAARDLRDRALLRLLLARTRYRTRHPRADRRQQKPASPPPWVRGWQQDVTQQHAVSDDGRFLTRSHALVGRDDAWAAGSLLPASGTTWWRVAISRKVQSGGLLCVGICDADCSVAWGLHLESGRLLRLARDPTSGHVQTFNLPAPPDGLPDGRGQKILADPICGTLGMQGPIAGSVVACGIDAAKGTFAISVNGGAARDALRQLPANVAFRPWARLAHAHDRAEIEFPLLNFRSRLRRGRALRPVLHRV